MHIIFASILDRLFLCWKRVPKLKILRIDWTFILYTVFEVRNRLEMFWLWSELFLASILDDRFPRWIRFRKSKCCELIEVSSYKSFLTWKIGWKWFNYHLNHFYHSAPAEFQIEFSLLSINLIVNGLSRSFDL